MQTKLIIWLGSSHAKYFWKRHRHDPEFYDVTEQRIVTVPSTQALQQMPKPSKTE